ncbi:MAG: hypothetical protein ACI8S2_001712, partial [Bacteroidia bacterium]
MAQIIEILYYKLKEFLVTNILERELYRYSNRLILSPQPNIKILLSPHPELSVTML